MITIQLTPEQTQMLIQLLMIGMKAGDFSNMRVGLPIADIIEASFKEYQQAKLSEVTK